MLIPNRSLRLVLAKYVVTPLTPTANRAYATTIPIAVPRPMIRPKPYEV